VTTLVDDVFVCRLGRADLDEGLGGPVIFAAVGTQAALSGLYVQHDASFPKELKASSNDRLNGAKSVLNPTILR
jgi:hypothetical protein